MMTQLTSQLRRLAALAAAGLLLSSCTIAQIQHDGTQPVPPKSGLLVDNAPNQPLRPGRERVDYPLNARFPGDPLVLMAISGGGSRSAYYAARVMEELSCIPAPSGSGSMMDSVRIMSTVSAGSLAASYYVTHYDQRHEPGFYDRFKEQMAANLQWRTYGHMMLFPPLALQLAASSVTRTDLLANEMEKIITDGEPLTFDHLRVNETREVDPTPVLVINGTIYNSGQRLVMTNLPATRFPSLIQPGSLGKNISPKDDQIVHNLVQPLTFTDFGSDVGCFRLAEALAASAAYPIILAPMRLTTYPNLIPAELQHRASPELLASKSIYIADGGLVENEGIDALLSVLKTLPRKQPVLLIVVDASQRMQTIKVSDHKIWDPISVISRMYDIGSLRPLAFYGGLVKDFHDSSKFDMVMIRMEGYDEETEKQLRNIPTTFKLSSRHRGALDTAAQQNVLNMSDNLIEAYSRLSSKAVSSRSRN